MTSALSSRLARLEDRVRPPGLAENPVLLIEPGPNADQRAWNGHRRRLTAAEAKHDRIIVVSSNADPGGGGRGKTRRVPDVLSGALMLLAVQRSGFGRRTKLDDVLASLKGTVVQPNSSAAYMAEDDEGDDHDA